MPDARLRTARLRAPIARDFDEAQHPRGPDGRFGEGGASGAQPRWNGRARIRLEKTLSSGEIRARAPLAPPGAAAPGPAAGVNRAELVTLNGFKGAPERAIWKPAAGERGTGATDRVPLRTNIDPGTYYKREVAVAAIARDCGAKVPPTVEREIGGERGSLQAFAEGAKPLTWKEGDALPEQLPRAEAEKMRVFDYAMGQSDRTIGNVLSGGELIDNGLALPKGPPDRFIQPLPFIARHAGPLLPETHDFIQHLDGDAIARHALAAGVEQEASVHAMRRVEAMKRDPSFLAIPPTVAPGGVHPDAAVLKTAQSWQMRAMFKAGDETQGLPQEVLDQIDERARKIYGQ